MYYTPAFLVQSVSWLDCVGGCLKFILARIDIWHPGGFHGNQDNIQDDRHFICPYYSFKMSYIY